MKLIILIITISTSLYVGAQNSFNEYSLIFINTENTDSTSSVSNMPIPRPESVLNISFKLDNPDGFDSFAVELTKNNGTIEVLSKEYILQEGGKFYYSEYGGKIEMTNNIILLKFPIYSGFKEQVKKITTILYKNDNILDLNETIIN